MLYAIDEGSYALMKKHPVTFYLDILGILFIIIPFLFTILMSINYSLNENMFIIDYLMPAELSFVVMPGALIIMLVSLKKKDHFIPKATLFSCMLLGLLIMMILPGLIGFGSDASLAQGFWYILTFVALGVYEITALTLCIYTFIKL
jgi:hypothetical protein